MIQVLDKSFEVFITKEELSKEIATLGEQISKDYKDGDLVFLSVLNGAFMFTSDLMKNITIDCEVSFVKLASYEGTNSTGKIKQLVGLNEDLEGRTVVILEDIIDTGNTLQEIYTIFSKIT